MYSRKRFFVAVVVVLVATAPAGMSMAADEAVDDVPLSVTALDQAYLDAVANAEPVAPDWLPSAGAQGVASPDGIGIRSIGTRVFTFGDQSLFDQEHMEALRGPQGVLFSRSVVAERNPPSSQFYDAQPVSTLVIAETIGWPPRSLGELFELALAINWPGDEKLEESPYEGDPLLDFGNVSSYGWFGDEPFTNYAKVQGGTWIQFADPLLSFETTVADGRHFVGWLVPGVPDALSLNLSYSPDLSIESMIAQRVEVPIPPDIAGYQLTADFSALAPDLQVSLMTLLATDDDPPAEEEPPAEDPPVEEDPPSNDEPQEENGTAGSATVGESDTTGTPEAASQTDETPPQQTGVAAGTEEPGDGSALALALSLLVLALGVGGLVMWRKSTSRSGGMTAVNPPEMPRSRRATGLPPVESHEAMMASVVDEVSVGSDGGDTPDAAGGSHPEEPVLTSHPNPPQQLMSARAEAFGLAEALDGRRTEDGWHRLPWATGMEFFVPEGKTATYRTIPERDIDVLTDVNFLGRPPGFEPDSTRFAYWLHEDGTLRIGSPTDPHAVPMNPPLNTLESMLPIPAAGDDVEVVLTQRVIKAHQLTGGAHPVDGWIAPSNLAHSAGMMADAGGPDHDPNAWSGNFINIDTLEWVDSRGPQQDRLMEKLAIKREPKPEPVENEEPWSLDDTVGPI